jgi:glycosyltransferase involved in cell wall biosynthesis
MRILHVSSLWDPVAQGGAELYATRLAAEQRGAGHAVGVITHGVDGAAGLVECVPAWPFRLDQHDGQAAWKRAVYRLEDVYNPLAAARIRRGIERFAPDVVHSHNVVGLSAVALTGGRGRVPHVHHVHDYWLMCRRTTMRLPNGELCRDRSCRLITAARSQIVRRHPPQLLLTGSRAAVEDHARLPWAAGRIRHLPPPVGAEFEAVRRWTHPPGAPVTFGYIGQLAATKGVHLLLRAFAELGGAHRLVVAGDGELAASVAAAGPRVTALGWVDEDAREQFFSGIDCLVVPSMVPETGPMVALEARARGIPIVGARIGGIPDTVGPRCADLLFAAADVDALREAMERFIADPARFVLPEGGVPERIGLSWRDHAAAVEALYGEAVDRSRSR